MQDLKSITAQISAEAEANSSDCRDCTSLKNKTGFRQGDVYVIKFDDEASLAEVFLGIQAKGDLWSDCVPTTLLKRKTNQIALGDSKGSRHIISGNCSASFYDDTSHACLGGIIVAEGDWELTHPEHANCKFGAGTYLFSYQMDARLEGVVMRVRD